MRTSLLIAAALLGANAIPVHKAQADTMLYVTCGVEKAIITARTFTVELDCHTVRLTSTSEVWRKAQVGTTTAYCEGRSTDISATGEPETPQIWVCNPDYVLAPR